MFYKGHVSSLCSCKTRPCSVFVKFWVFNMWSVWWRETNMTSSCAFLLLYLYSDGQTSLQPAAGVRKTGNGFVATIETNFPLHKEMLWICVIYENIIYSIYTIIPFFFFSGQLKKTRFLRSQCFCCMYNNFGFYNITERNKFKTIFVTNCSHEYASYKMSACFSNVTSSARTTVWTFFLSQEKISF